MTKFQKILGFLGILGLCRFGEFSPSLKSQNLHRPKIPKNPDEQSAGFMHRPKIPKNPKIFRNYQARPWQSSKKSWDSWESWACAWILHFVHRDSWESWACAGFMKVLCESMLFIRKKCMFPVFFDGEPQNLCRWSSFSGRNFENGEPDSGFALLGVFLRQMIAIEIILHIVYSKNTGIYSGFCMCHILKDEDEDIYVIHPLLQVGPGRGGDHIYIYGSPPPGTYLFQFYTSFTVFKASPVKGFEGTGIPYSL